MIEPNLQELILIDFVRAEDLKLLDLLPKLTRLRIDVLSRRRDNDAVYYCEELLNSLTQLSLGRITVRRLPPKSFYYFRCFGHGKLHPGYFEADQQKAKIGTATHTQNCTACFKKLILPLGRATALWSDEFLFVMCRTWNWDWWKVSQSQSWYPGMLMGPTKEFVPASGQLPPWNLWSYCSLDLEMHL